MALPESGPISMNMVNIELGRSSTATISLNDQAVRTLFGKASGQISLSDGRGKSAVSAPVITAGPSGYVWTAGGKTISYSNAGHSNLEYSAPNTPYAVGTTGGTLHQAMGTITIAYTVTGTNNVYRWQYAPNLYGGGPYSNVQGVSEEVNSPFMIRQSPEFRDHPIQPLGDIVNTANTNTLSLSLRNFPIQFGYQFGYPQVPVVGNPAAGYWRLKVSNSLGTVYSGWTNVYKLYAQYSYNCACTTNCSSCCTCGCSTCYDQCCDENGENCDDCNPHDCDCNDCCSDCYCTGGCSTCYAYAEQVYAGSVYFANFMSYSDPLPSNPGYVNMTVQYLT